MGDPEDRKRELIAQLRADVKSLYASGRTNNLVDVWLSVITVLGSLAATVLTGTQAVPPVVVAVAAALPAAAASTQRLVNFRGRSAWYFRLATRVSALELDARFGSSTLAELAERRGKLEVSMEDEWAAASSAEVDQGRKPKALPQS
jgi:hypothetical protein